MQVEIAVLVMKITKSVAGSFLFNAASEIGTQARGETVRKNRNGGSSAFETIGVVPMRIPNPVPIVATKCS
jgi:hypothetical protein